MSEMKWHSQLCRWERKPKTVWLLWLTSSSYRPQWSDIMYFTPAC